MRAYQTDLAHIHHTGFTGFASNAAPGLLNLLRQHRIRSGLVVDVGCGSGVWAGQLTKSGYDVLGIDISPAMIRLARRNAPRAQFRTGSLFAAELPRCDAVTAIGECVNYAFDTRSGLKGLAAFFRRVHAALRPGGILIFDVVEPGLVPGGPQRKFSEGPDWVILLEVSEDAAHGLLTRRIVSFRRAGKAYRRSEETHRLHLYRQHELLDALRRAGFEARVLKGYGRFRFTPAHAAFVARKAR